MQEITMIVLKIYVMSSDTENPKLYEDYEVPKLIYDEWIIDMLCYVMYNRWEAKGFPTLCLYINLFFIYIFNQFVVF